MYELVAIGLAAAYGSSFGGVITCTMQSPPSRRPSLFVRSDHVFNLWRPAYLIGWYVARNSR